MNRFEKINILNGAKTFLNEEQMDKLTMLLEKVDGSPKETPSNNELLKLFETAKNVEC